MTTNPGFAGLALRDSPALAQHAFPNPDLLRVKNTADPHPLPNFTLSSFSHLS